MNTTNQTDEGFLGRWSRLKQGQAKGGTSGEGETAPADSIAPPPQDEAPEEPAEARILTDEDMPPLETLDVDSDYSPFMSVGVSEELRRLALRKLFAAPVFNVRDGLDDYDEDYTNFAKLDPGVVTADMKYMLEVEARRALEKAVAEAGNTTSSTSPIPDPSAASGEGSEDEQTIDSAALSEEKTA